ncbi:Major facilitator superfamily protein [Sulfitobacter noctilucicola]|uniref:Bcr/CflA family efflux transporter n=1 Tax=Sulfitobacter noctilucicola TaxID=1342301 RepID=A0A7W6M8D4_9RHOB|nr:Bcr/CflA family efflux MFS transporter [Sulfitobacter noctilucicola]KIN64883.1 Major facilitator superfamily protein [Sulfitobacter noctilucicola]MBB4173973.1 DHA1 family bicyclomycin/chloramphenicol resistance-like MFS transporter [Sulfitobacter noctilucicola]
MKRTPPHLGTLVALTALTVLTLNMFLPALPEMQKAFGVSEAVMGLAISGYMGAAAVLQLIIGPVSDRLGRRPVALSMLALYVVASVICLLAQDVHVFLGARIVQAVAVGGGVLASAVVRDMFDGRVAAAKLATIASAMAIAPMLAPMLGGVLTSVMGWRAVFVVYAVIGTGLLALMWHDLGETQVKTPGQPPERISGLLTTPLFWAYAFCQALGVGAFYVFLTGSPFVAVALFGLTAAQVGLGLGSITGGFMLGSAVSARLVSRTGPMALILTGRLLPLAILSIGWLYFSLGGDQVLVLFAATLSVGFGNGLTLANANAGALSVRPRLAGTAAGVAGALALAIGAALTAVATALLSLAATPERLLSMMICVVFLSLIAALAARRLDKDV